MAWVRAAALAAAAGAALACASGGGRPRRPPADPGLRIWVDPVLRWEWGTARAVAFAIENGTNRTLELPAPDPSAARVAIYPDAGEVRACGVEPDVPRSAGAVRLAPGDQVPVRVDLRDACGTLAPGEYRFELSYRSERTSGGTLTLATRYGTLVVEGPARAPSRPAEAASPGARSARSP
jgi:hypothetical protein